MARAEAVEFNAKEWYVTAMTKLEKIEQEIATLSPAEIFKLANWFAEFHADAWDQQIAEDASAGKFDKLAEQALADHKAGRTERL